MSETLIIAIVGQVVTLSIVILQQVFNMITLKQQSKNENRKSYYQQKVTAYKLLVEKINVDMFDRDKNFSQKNLDFFYKEVFIYASDEIVDLFGIFYENYLDFLDLLENEEKNKKKITAYSKKLGGIAAEIHQCVRKELSE